MVVVPNPAFLLETCACPRDTRFTRLMHIQSSFPSVRNTSVKAFTPQDRQVIAVRPCVERHSTSGVCLRKGLFRSIKAAGNQVLFSRLVFPPLLSLSPSPVKAPGHLPIQKQIPCAPFFFFYLCRFSSFVFEPFPSTSRPPPPPPSFFSNSFSFFADHFRNRIHTSAAPSPWSSLSLYVV